MMNGSPAGTIRLSEYNPIGITISPSALVYSAPSPEVVKVLSGGTIRQLFAPNALADIVTINSTSFEIRFYDWTDVGSFNGSIYTLSGNPDPFVTYTISKPNTYAIRIRKTAGSTSNSSAVYWETDVSITSAWPNPFTIYDWTENGTAGSNCLRKFNITYSYNGNYTYQYVTEQGRPDTSSSFSTSSGTYYTYYNYSWGKELLSVKEGSNSNGSSFIRQTQFEYYSTSETSDGLGNYRQLKKVTRPDGGYTRYVYYNDFDKLGQLRYEYSPFQDDQEGLVKEYKYDDDDTGENFLTSEVITKADGKQIGLTESAYSSETISGEPVMKIVRKDYHDSGATDYVQTIIKVFRKTAANSFKRGRLCSIVRPDKTQTSYYYVGSSGFLMGRAFPEETCH